MDNKDIKTTNSRRKFIVRAGMGSLPVLMALKSKGAWGYSTQNCNLSASMSQMQSAQAEQFETCTAAFNSHGAAKQYFDLNKGLGKGNERSGYYHSASANYHRNAEFTYNFNGFVINEKTMFSDIFQGGASISLAEAVYNGSTSLERDIAALFLHSMFYRGQGMYPEPDAFVEAYSNAMLTGKTDQLAKVLQMYIDGEKAF